MTSTTPRQAVIFHGYGATPEDHWFGWLADQLNQTGISAHVPALPDSAAPDPARWAAASADVLGTPGSESIVIAHSLGCITVLRHLSSLSIPWRVRTLVLVAGFVDKLPALPVLDSFIGDGVNLAGIRGHVGSLVVMRSDDDPYVPTGHTDRLARLLDVSPLVVPGAGHFLASDGVTSLPHVLEVVL
jgi:predicted alpha/beta hydrolase family esterase